MRVQVILDQPTLDGLATLEGRHGCNRSEAIRRAVAIALANLDAPAPAPAPAIQQDQPPVPMPVEPAPAPAPAASDGIGCGASAVHRLLNPVAAARLRRQASTA